MKKFIKADNDVAKMKQRHLDAYERRANKKQNALEDIKTADDSLQVAFDAGAKRVLLPMSSAGDIPTVPAELFAKFQISFYSSPEDAVIKALGIE
jgi:predicted ATP-dependent Lon-type protease